MSNNKLDLESIAAFQKAWDKEFETGIREPEVISDKVLSDEELFFKLKTSLPDWPGN